MKSTPSTSSTMFSRASSTVWSYLSPAWFQVAVLRRQVRRAAAAQPPRSHCAATRIENPSDRCPSMLE
jgi:hypothetical protein